MHRLALGALAALLSATVLVPAQAARLAAARVVAIGDVHGAAESFAAILIRAGLIDAQHRWTGGNTVLVQTGDMTDRGAGMRAALDLLMALEQQAPKSRGRVLPLLGNHEVMNMVGEMRDVTPEIFATFGGEAAMREAFGPRGQYGKWLRRKPVVGQVDGTVFMHAGINPAFSEVSVRAINTRAQRELQAWDNGVEWLKQRKLVTGIPPALEAVKAAQAELERLVASPTRDEPETRADIAQLVPLIDLGASSLFNPEGPLWFRGFATWTDEEGAPQITAILDKLRAKRLVTGHTVQPERRITERFGGRLFLIDTGMLGGRFFPDGRASALEITGDTTRPLYLE